MLPLDLLMTNKKENFHMEIEFTSEENRNNPLQRCGDTASYPVQSLIRKSIARLTVYTQSV